jgi:CRP-like cAMP-binding protein
MIRLMDLPSPYDRMPPRARFRQTREVGELLYQQDAPASGPYFIRSGEVLLRRRMADGSTVDLHRAGAGDVIAETAIIAETHDCDAVALSPVQATGFKRANILNHIAAEPEFVAGLVERLAGALQDARTMRDILSMRSAEDRVLTGLRMLGQNGTVTAFAARLGLTQEATSRTLTRLVDAGMIERLGRGQYRAR